MFEDLLRKYAKLAVKMGVNIQKDQILRIRAPLEAAALVHYCQEEAYELGARKVLLDYNDEIASKIDLKMADSEVLCEFPKYKEEELHYLINERTAVLNIYCETPGLLNDIDPTKMQKVMQARAINNRPYQEYNLSNKGQWSIISYPCTGWAQKVFPELDSKEAVEKLWENIFYSSRVAKDSDPIKAWKDHNETLANRTQKLNDYNFDYLTFKNSLGTDLKVHLAINHRWAGGCEKTVNDVIFNPNIPSEECFCMPLKTKVEGKVVASKPLNYQGKLIEDFWLVFKEGKVVDYYAKKEREALSNIIEFDEGSSYLGEVALIPYDSPISNTGILFYNTLFDENASCHLALGSAFTMNIKEVSKYNEEELKGFGYNKSLAHEDFMFGSEDMLINGYTFAGQEIAVFKEGNFVF